MLSVTIICFAILVIFSTVVLYIKNKQFKNESELPLILIYGTYTLIIFICFVATLFETGEQIFEWFILSLAVAILFSTPDVDTRKVIRINCNGEALPEIKFNKDDPKKIISLDYSLATTKPQYDLTLLSPIEILPSKAPDMFPTIKTGKTRVIILVNGKVIYRFTVNEMTIVQAGILTKFNFTYESEGKK